ncbi:MAG: AmmeMemoRadiSam system radical SAM enzyme [candidate division WOR-3 bacterium]|nr:AmmeMemoRadiSam system radical SAM enzyme [candidate division WOR-3 bacterium]
MQDINRLKEAKYYKTIQKAKKEFVQCELCPNFCVIAEGKVGLCLGRKNIGGKLYAINYGEVISMALDPIEKKPLYHYFPGSQIFSIATYGCNLRCPFCQNWEISQQKINGRYLSPQQLIEIAQKYPTVGIAYTYTEPLIWFEYLQDVTKLARKQGLKNVLVTNGMINPEPLNELLPWIDALNIDLKSIDESFYQDFVKGSLPAVKTTIELAQKKCHIELTNLIIPTKNDSKESLENLVNYVASLGKDTVLHFSRYFPHYQLDIVMTPSEKLQQALKIAKEKLNYVYVGNILGFDNNTYCPNCKNLLIDRGYFTAKIVGMKDNQCSRCGHIIYGRF